MWVIKYLSQILRVIASLNMTFTRRGACSQDSLWSVRLCRVGICR